MSNFRANIIKLSDLISEEYPENRWIIEQLVPEEGIVILSGASGSFKTWLIMDMALAVAEGRDFLGMFKTEQSKVLIIDEENGKRLYNERFKKITTLTEAPIYLSSMGKFMVNGDDVKSVVEFCKRERIRLVIIDSMARVNTGDENSSKDTTKFFALLRDFTGNSISVILIHHNRKPGMTSYDASVDMRGSSDIRAAIDVQLAVRRSGTSETVELRQPKCRYNREMSPIKLEFKKNKDTNLLEFKYIGGLRDDDADIDKERAAGLKSAIINTIQSFPGINKGAAAVAVANATGIGIVKSKAAIMDMIKEGVIITTTGKHNAIELNLVEQSGSEGKVVR